MFFPVAELSYCIGISKKYRTAVFRPPDCGDLPRPVGTPPLAGSLAGKVAATGLALEALNSLTMSSEVELNLYGIFRKYADENKFKVEIEPGISVEDLMRQLRLPKMIYMMVLVNQIRVKLDHPLSPGDEIHIFQPIGGG